MSTFGGYKLPEILISAYENAMQRAQQQRALFSEEAYREASLEQQARDTVRNMAMNMINMKLTEDDRMRNYDLQNRQLEEQILHNREMRKLQRDQTQLQREAQNLANQLRLKEEAEQNAMRYGDYFASDLLNKAFERYKEKTGDNNKLSFLSSFDPFGFKIKHKNEIIDVSDLFEDQHFIVKEKTQNMLRNQLESNIIEELRRGAVYLKNEAESRGGSIGGESAFTALYNFYDFVKNKYGLHNLPLPSREVMSRVLQDAGISTTAEGKFRAGFDGNGNLFFTDKLPNE